VAYERGGVRVRPIGEIDMGSIDRLRERTNEVMAAGPTRLVLDLRATTFLDSSGLHLVLEMDEWAAANGAEFMIVGGPRAIRVAFDAAGLSACLPLVDGAQYAAHAATFSPR
jgi:anti-sigma B factor antagonist